MKNRVLFISNVSAGLLHFRRELIETLSQSCELTVLASDNGGREELEAMGCRFVDLPMDQHGTNPVKELGLMRRYRNLIRSIAPDIVFTYTIKPNIYAGAACAALKVPYVANITGLGTAVENGGMMQKLTLLLYRWGLRGAQKVFFQNTENRDFLLRRGVVKGPYDLLPGSGVNLERYKLLPYPQSETVDFAFIARIRREKGIDQVLEAAETLRKTHPEVRFHICGGCEQSYEELLRRKDEEGVIIYHGRVKNIAAIHEISQCTVHPTYYPEGMSNVLLESCASGRPIITTDRPGCREIVEDGVNGFVVRQKDSADLIEKLERFLSLSWEQRRDMGLAGRAKVEREFDRQVVVNKYLGELHDGL